MHALAQLFVLAGGDQQVLEPAPELVALVAQDRHLVLDQGDRPAAGVEYLHLPHQVPVAHEEIRVLPQVVGHDLLEPRHPGTVRARRAHSSISPSKTVTAGPVIHTESAPDKEPGARPTA